MSFGIDPPVETGDPFARDYEEKANGFLVIGNERGHGLRILGFFQTQEKAEETARTRTRNGQCDNACVVPAQFFIGAKPNLGF